VPALYRFVALPRAILESVELKSEDVVVAAMLIAWSREGHGIVNIANLSRRTRVLLPNVEGAITRLRDAGYIAHLARRLAKSGEPLLEFQLRIPDDRPATLRSQGGAL
jgi:hypothetical protein